MPLTTEELINTIEGHQSTIMFWNRGVVHEDMIRNSTGQLARIGRALDKYPPVYQNDYDMDLYELLTKRQITFIIGKRIATLHVKKNRTS